MGLLTRALSPTDLRVSSWSGLRENSDWKFGGSYLSERRVNFVGGSEAHQPISALRNPRPPHLLPTSPKRGLHRTVSYRNQHFLGTRKKLMGKLLEILLVSDEGIITWSQKSNTQNGPVNKHELNCDRSIAEQLRIWLTKPESDRQQT